MNNTILAYSRADAIADGVQFKCDLAKEAGFEYPVFITEGINTLINKSLPHGNDYNGVMWDILNILFFKIKSSKSTDFIDFKVAININNKADTFVLYAQVGATDFNNPKPAITIMTPEEY